MNSKERAKARQEVLEGVRDGSILVGDGIARLNEIDIAYQRSKERPPVYALVSQIDQLTRALLSVAETPHAQAGVLDTIVDAIARHRTTLALDAAIAQFAAQDEIEFKSAEDR